MLMVGHVLEGYCSGYFGRDVPLEGLRIEAVGADWVVARDAKGGTWFGNGDNIHRELGRCVKGANDPVMD